ncbi:DUF1036 domain-containing protein [Brevibacillus laterosporus]|uniref:DUF1036 domain-containing protein n=1 Tax=Brevibacillus laterosporus TaxID=1465 RepID=UPI003D1C85E9
MALYFRNDTGRTLWLAIAYEDNRCTGSKWRKEGWKVMGPRSSIRVYNGPTKNKRFYFFANDRGYEYTWSGNTYTDLPSHPFDRCWDEPGGERRGMESFIAAADEYTWPLYIR